MYSNHYCLMPRKKRLSPDFIFEGDGFSFLYTYIRKNASTSFKKLFKSLYPDLCPGNLPQISCMIKKAAITALTPDEINERFKTKLFVYRNPIERAFSVYKNKLIQQDGATDILSSIEKVLKRDPRLISFEEFVNEYVSLIKTERWESVDGHLHPQVWHLLPITYNKVIHMDSIHKEMQDILPEKLCDDIFKTPSNSTTENSIPLDLCDTDHPAVYFQKKYQKTRALPALKQVLSLEIESVLKEIYAEDFKMIKEIEGTFLQKEKTQSAFNFNLSPTPTTRTSSLEKELNLDFSTKMDETG